ncbi:hypothetical protein ACA910_004187 [Epithemia clementina (nom. ined.)]
MSNSAVSQAGVEKRNRLPMPPIARRDDDRVVYIGAAPPGWDPELPRQAEDSKEPLIDPPIALPDPYGWMRDESRKDPVVLEHLRLENEYTQKLAAPLASFREGLYQEFLSRIQETDHSVPRPIGQSPWLHYTRTYEGKAFDVYCRARKQDGYDATVTVRWDGMAESPILAGEEILLDVNELGEGKDYCVVGCVETSPSHQLLAYSTDFVGEERYSLVVKNLETGEFIEDGTLVNNIDGSVVWGKDDSTLFYTKLDDASRPYQVYRRSVGIGKEQTQDELIFEENDEMFFVDISKTLDERYIIIDSASTETSEVHYIDLQNEDKEKPVVLECICKRQYKVLYRAEHRHGCWWIQSNIGNLTNFALFTAPVANACQDNWVLVVGEKQASGEPLFDGSHRRSLDSVTCLDSHVVILGREEGLPRLWILSIGSSDAEDDKDCSANPVVVSKFERLEFDEEAFDVGLGENYDFHAKSILIEYDSLTTSTQRIDVHLDNASTRTLVKERNVPSYDKELYASKRTFVVARDGTSLPVDMLYRKDVMSEIESTGQRVPVHMYGYGAYGACEEASFSASLLPLLDRGVVYVLTHVRGGGEMGRQWYEEPNGGKYLCKKNTFNDFVDIARWLIHDLKLTSPDKLSCEGSSAGGVLIAGSINQAPELFRVAILGVPAVDLFATMSDSSINLVITEWEEWGNPNEMKFFEYMKDYSPMDNVKKDATYPACLLTGGLYDPRVQFWEPSKFTAQLRYTVRSEESRPICLKMEMNAGHFSASDRYKYWRELAFDYAFLLDQLGLTHVENRSSGGGKPVCATAAAKK